MRSREVEARRGVIRARIPSRVAYEFVLVLCCAPLAVVVGLFVGAIVGALIPVGKSFVSPIGSLLAIVGVLVLAIGSLRSRRRVWLRRQVLDVRGIVRHRRLPEKRNTTLGCAAVGGVALSAILIYAIPQFMTFGCRSKASEARSMLMAISVAEQAYRGEFGTYLSLTDLTTFGGLSERMLQGRHYKVVEFQHTKDAFSAKARDDVHRISPANRPDEWTVSHDVKPANVQNGCVKGD